MVKVWSERDATGTVYRNTEKEIHPIEGWYTFRCELYRHAKIIATGAIMDYGFPAAHIADKDGSSIVQIWTDRYDPVTENDLMKEWWGHMNRIDYLGFGPLS